jgi:23S rRNA pseudouridine1911/1915/1917 synthase
MKLLRQKLAVGEAGSGLRLDQALSRMLPEYSRSRIQGWIRDGSVTLNQRKVKPRDKVFAGDQLELDVPYEVNTVDLPEAVEFELLYEDEHLLVVNKPPGLVVHPAAGHASGTLVNGLLNHDAALEQLPRAGIVHRLDKDTSGVMVVARSLPAHHALVDALQQRLVKREYVALARGVITAGRTIDEPIARHPVDRKRMAVRASGRQAVTHFTVRQRFRGHSLLDVRLETGRTHQIRVHLAHIRHPLVGDPVYGGRFAVPSGISAEFETVLRDFRRQALHARRLSFDHPVSGEALVFEAPEPADLRALFAALNRDNDAAT